LDEDKGMMPPFFELPDKIDKKRGLNSVIRTGWKGRSDDTDVHRFVMVIRAGDL
jgi:hypothetical protein